LKLSLGSKNKTKKKLNNRKPRKSTNKPAPTIAKKCIALHISSLSQNVFLSILKSTKSWSSVSPY
jgi:ribosomal protein S25